MKTVIWVLGVLLAILALYCLSLRCRRRHPLWDRLKMYRYAHRGYHDKPTIPENSMAAFRRAAERGWGAELDVHLMADGNLAVIHDSSLQRTAGAEVDVETLRKEDLARYPLEDSREQIPLLEQVLELFAHGGPLIIELKPYQGNHNELAQALWQRLQSYPGLYCVESFDPRALHWFVRHAPQVVRGQLAEDFLRHDAPLKGITARILQQLGMNFLSVPDFIAYRLEDRKRCPGLSVCRRVWGAEEASWTLRTPAELSEAEQVGSVPIFECFDPEKG